MEEGERGRGVGGWDMEWRRGAGEEGRQGGEGEKREGGNRMRSGLGVSHRLDSLDVR